MKNWAEIEFDLWRPFVWLALVHSFTRSLIPFNLPASLLFHISVSKTVGVRWRANWMPATLFDTWHSVCNMCIRCAHCVSTSSCVEGGKGARKRIWKIFFCYFFCFFSNKNKKKQRLRIVELMSGNCQWITAQGNCSPNIRLSTSYCC